MEAADYGSSRLWKQPIMEAADVEATEKESGLEAAEKESGSPAKPLCSQGSQETLRRPRRPDSRASPLTSKHHLLYGSCLARTPPPPSIPQVIQAIQDTRKDVDTNMMSTTSPG